MSLEKWTQQQIENAGRKKPRGIPDPRRVASEYNAALQKLVKMIKEDVDTNLTPLLRQLSPQYTTDSYSDDIISALNALRDRWASPRFAAVANGIASQFVQAANNWNKKKFDDDMDRFGIRTYGDVAGLDDLLNLSASDNVSLIQSIPDQYLKQVESIIMGNVRRGGRPADIEQALRDRFGVTQSRAKLIARDQTAKINSELAQKRQVAAGFTVFKWKTSGDSRVRDRHEEIANKVTEYGPGVYRYDLPPKDDKGQPILPGQDYQCRCVAIPVTQKQVEKYRANGQTRPGVKR